MPRHRVLITDIAWPDTAVESSVLGECDAELFLADATDEACLCRAAADVDAIMATWAQVTKAVIDAAPRRRIVARLGIGLDNIDVAHCTKLDVPVTNVPDYCLIEVAEHALALLFALGRRVACFHQQTKAGVYELQAGGTIQRLEGQTVGVLGLGNIGRTFAAKCLALGMRVLAVARAGHEMTGVEFVSQEELFRRSDFISLHVPLNPQTQHLVSTETLAWMKPTAFLINTARGGLVDPQALGAALRSGQLAGAGLDVQTPEPPDLSQSPWNDPRVIVTPHAAFVSEASIVELRRRAAEQVRDALQGRRPPNVVNPRVFGEESELANLAFERDQ